MDDFKVGEKVFQERLCNSKQGLQPRKFYGTVEAINAQGRLWIRFHWKRKGRKALMVKTTWLMPHCVRHDDRPINVSEKNVTSTNLP